MKRKNRRKFTHEEIKHAKNHIRKHIASRGMSYGDVVAKVKEQKPEASDSANNLTRKLNDGTLKFIEALEIADALDYEIKWESRM
jgi:uncharacterized protein YoaH (UPF0181 family)